MVAATAAPKLLPLRRYSSSFGPANNLTGSSKVAVHFPYSCFSSDKVKGSLPIRALDPRRRDEEEDSSNSTGFNSENDLEYLGKVLAASIVGGAVIKYGSIVFPEITRSTQHHTGSNYDIHSCHYSYLASGQAKSCKLIKPAYVILKIL